MAEDSEDIQPAKAEAIKGSPSSLRDELMSEPARWISFLVMALASSAFTVWFLGIKQWFVTDEFDYFASGHQQLLAWLIEPRNQHTVLITKVLFWILPEFVGHSHYVLYMLPIALAHLVVVAAIYGLTWIGSASRVMATGTALIALAMGAGVGTLTLAGQIQLVGSVAAGLTAILLAIQSSSRRALVVLMALSAFGTLNGNAFLAFGLVASIFYARRRLWLEAIVAAAIPIGWELTAQFIWPQGRPFAARDLAQVFRDGPAFAYGILDKAISDTLGVPTLTSVVLAILVLGSLALMSASPRWRRTELSGRVVAALAFVAIVTMVALISSRLSRGVALSAVGGYSYLFLVSFFPLSGILLSHIARSKAALLGAAGVFVTISLIGVVFINDNAKALGAWKIGGEYLMQTAAAELNAGMPTFPDQIPVPDTAPTVNQTWLRSLAASGQLDALIAGPVQADQASLNMQWRVVPVAETSGVCRNLAAGADFAAPVGASVTILGLQPGAAVDVRYANSPAVRHFDLPVSAISLQTVSQRGAIVTVQAGSVSACLPS